MISNDADRIANSVDPDLSVQILRRVQNFGCELLKSKCLSKMY